MTHRTFPQRVAIDARGAIEFHLEPLLLDALTAIESRQPAVIIIDASSSFTLFLRLFRSARMLAQLDHIPILAGIGDADPGLIAQAIDSGVDDCLTTELQSAESIARIRAASRRTARQINATTIRHGTLILDKARLKVWNDGRTIALTIFQLRLLEFLMTHPGEVFSRRQLLDQVWDGDTTDPGAVTACIKRIRHALGQDHEGLIRSVRGAGYALDCNERDAAQAAGR